MDLSQGESFNQYLRNHQKELEKELERVNRLEEERNKKEKICQKN